MNAKDMISGIIDQKEKSGKTNQQIADETNLSKTTVDRFLRNEEGQNPSMQTAFDIANAVGYKLGGAPTEGLGAVTHEIIGIYEEQLRSTRAHYEKRIRSLTQWLRFAVVLALVVIAIGAFLLVYDVLHPDAGWIRDHLQSYTPTAYQLLLSLPRLFLRG